MITDVKELKDWARANRDAAMVVLEARVFAELERKRVNAYVLPIFQRYGFTDENGKAIPSPERLYLCKNECLVADYYADCDRAHQAHGFTGPEGYCPALVAESAVIDAENALLASMGILAGVDGRDFSMNLDLRKRSLDWALSVCINGANL